MLLRLRSDARRQWRTWLFVGALVGLVAGCVAAAFASARRTESAYDRFFASTNGFDLLVAASCDGPCGEDPAAWLRADPAVEDAALVVNIAADFVRPDGRPVDPSGDLCYAGPGQMVLLVSADGRFGSTLNQTVLVAGRKATSPFEVVIAESLAERARLEVGDTIVLAPPSCQGEAASSPRVELTVVGVELSPGELEPERGFYVGAIHATAALEEHVAAVGYPRNEIVAMRLREGASPDDVASTSSPAGLSIVEVASGEDIREGMQNGLDADSDNLVLLGVLTAVAAAVLLIPLLSRVGRAALVEAPILRGLGVTSRQLAALGAGYGLIVGIVAIPLVALTQIALSWFTPIGRARSMTPHHAWYADPAVLVLTALGVVLCGVVSAGATAASFRRPRTTRAPTSGAGRLLSALRLPPAMAAGARMALEPRQGTGRIPVLGGLLGIAVAIGTIIGVMTYRESVELLERSPSLAGWSWTDAILLDFPRAFSDDAGPSVDTLADYARGVPGVTAASRATFSDQPSGDGTVVRAGGREQATTFVAFETGTGKVVPAVLRGRPPSGPDEVTLSRQLMAYLDVEEGDTIEVAGDWGSQPFEIVGTSVLPVGSNLDAVVATGAMTLDGFHRFQPDHPGNYLFVTLDDGRSATDLAGELADAGYPVGAPLRDQRDIGAEELSGTSLGETATLPVLLGLLMAAGGIGVLAHLVATASRSRRHEIGVLRALGFRRSNVVESVGLQALILFTLAAIVGLPLGLVAGRVAWGRTADHLGVIEHATLPWAGIAVVLATGVVCALATAAWPAWRGASTQVVTVLRAE